MHCVVTRLYLAEFHAAQCSPPCSIGTFHLTPPEVRPELMSSQFRLLLTALYEALFKYKFCSLMGLFKGYGV